VSDGSDIDNPGAIIATFFAFAICALIGSGYGFVGILAVESSTALILAIPIAILIGVIASYIRICRRIVFEFLLGWWV